MVRTRRQAGRHQCHHLRVGPRDDDHVREYGAARPLELNPSGAVAEPVSERRNPAAIDIRFDARDLRRTGESCAHESQPQTCYCNNKTHSRLLRAAPWGKADAATTGGVNCKSPAHLHRIDTNAEDRRVFRNGTSIAPDGLTNASGVRGQSCKHGIER
jgi:hypothetical protein